MTVANSKRTKAFKSTTQDQDLEKEVVRLTRKWYGYVNFDHHKDRDCHWYITKTYSYGDPAKYVASHSGYRSERWESKPVKTEEDAMMLLIKHLNEIIKEARDSTKVLVEENKQIPPSERWHSLEQLEAELKVLEK